MKRIVIIAVLFIYANIFANTGKLNLTKGMEKYRLPNGMTVVLKRDSSSPLVGLAVLYRVGFRNEQKGKSGLTHLLEHMMFKGTKRYGKGEIAKTLHSVGAEFNAFTSYDKTVYWEVLPSDSLELAMDIEADRMQNSLLDPKEFEKEKQVVLSELNMHEGNPMVKLRHAMYKKAFGDHPFAWDYGFIDEVKNASRDYVYNELYKKYYVPNNATVFVVGNYDAREVKKLINRYFGKLKRNPRFKQSKVKPIKWNLGETVRLKGVASENFGNILFKLPAANINDDDYIALSFLEWSNMLGGFYYWDTPDGGVGYLGFSKEPDYPAESLSDAFIKKNLADFKARVINRERMDYDSISSIMMSLVWLESKFGAEHYAELIKKMNALSSDKLIAVVHK
ncbi:MAG: insulinase family protein, partial [Bacteroidetes bacterium]